MAYENCLDYLRLRGIFPGSVAPFCPVDNLILSVCAYVPWEEAVPTLRDGDWLPFPQAVEALTSHPDWDAVGLIMPKDTPTLVVEAARSPRFRPLALGCCEHVQDENTQFAALTYRLPDGTLYLAFRGTDDSLAGWKECFALSYTTVPAQKLAQEYLIQVARRYPGKLRVGGHSKGGNLAVWAAVILAMGLLGRRLSRWLKKRGVSRRVNQAATLGCILLLTVAGLAGITAGILTGLLSFGDGHQPVDSYQWGNLTWDIYDDPMPLTVEDLAETDTRYSKEAHCQETFLLSRCEYDQRPLFNQEERDYQLSYTVTNVKLPALYDFIRQSLLKERQDEVIDDYVFVDHYEPLDAAPWGAQAAYQVRRDEDMRDTYLICWERRMVEITFYWTPTPEQIRTAGEILGG